jgi:hypothetical protein
MAIESVYPDDLRQFYTDRKYYLTVGTIPNSGGLPATIINRSFGPWQIGGYGEARHVLIVGQNGSAKTVLALTLIVGKLAQHPEMGFLAPDTAGDIANPTRHDRGSFKWNWVEALKAARIRIDIINIEDIRLHSREMFKNLFMGVLHKAVNTDADHSLRLAEEIIEALFEGGPIEANKLTTDRLITEIRTRIANVYAGGSKTQKEEEARRLETDMGKHRAFDKAMTHIRLLFDGREDLMQLISDVLTKGRKVVIKMDSARLYEKEQEAIMQEIMEQLQSQAAIIFKKGEMGNALVALDEGTRWVPEGSFPDGSCAETVKRAFRETRKYGVGWMVISQRISEIAKTVLTQAHEKYFGKGVGGGNDRSHLRDQIGEAGLEMYDDLAKQGGFPWVAVGHSNNLGTEGMYFTFYPFDGDATNALIEANPHVNVNWRR